jgi:hypothetical protein
MARKLYLALRGLVRPFPTDTGAIDLLVRDNGVRKYYYFSKFKKLNKIRWGRVEKRWVK